MVYMNTLHKRAWKVLSWNVQGINSNSKWESIRNKITENRCDIICLQETKKMYVDLQFLKKICPASFDNFVYVPSRGASGGMLVSWKGVFFEGTLVFQKDFAMSVEFKSLHTGNYWMLTNIYAPCTPKGKREFCDWFKNIQMPDEHDWLIVGDFNLMRAPENRNRPGGDVSEMLLFNEAISYLGLIEIPLHGKHFTWSNKQQPPLLERIDWFFTSISWTLLYPSTKATSLVAEVSDHSPCLIEVATYIPKGSIGEC